jgi:hypothetical protein
VSQSKFPTAEQIEKRAYELYLERGCEDGHDLTDWLAAQIELSGLSGQSPLPKPKARFAGAEKSADAQGVKR